MYQTPDSVGETPRTQRILKYLKKIPFSFAAKLHGNPMQRAGMPDVLFIYKGQAWLFEVKAARGVTSKLQKHTIEELRSAGTRAHVVYCWEEVELLLKKERVL